MKADQPTFEDVLAAELRACEPAYLAYHHGGGTEEWPQWYARRLEATFGGAFEYEELLTALNAAAAAHGVHEERDLGGVRDEEWPRWYAAHMADALTGARQRFAANLDALEDWA